MKKFYENLTKKEDHVQNVGPRDEKEKTETFGDNGTKCVEK